MEFNTVSISDGITMGTEGMRTSMVSREVIADSIELAALGNHFGAMVALVGCDKTIPGAAMAVARLNLPGLVLYGGTIAPGSCDGQDVTIQGLAAFGLPGIEVHQRNEVVAAAREARRHKGTHVINFCVEQEDSVFPIVPAGADLHAMIRRPSPLVETAADM